MAEKPGEKAKTETQSEGSGEAATVKNTTEQPLALPDGTLLPPGEEVVVPAWDQWEDNDTVAEWIEEGTIEVSDAPEETEEQKRDRELQKQREDQLKRDEDNLKNRPGASGGAAPKSSTEDQERQKAQERERQQQQDKARQDQTKNR